MLEKKRIIDCEHEIARKFFLLEECYSRIELPLYFQFKEVIDFSDKILRNGDKIRPLKEISQKSKDFDRCNYRLLSSKDGRYTWRPFHLIHPLIYVEMVNILTETNNWEEIVKRFRDFQKPARVQCLSLPLVLLEDGELVSSRTKATEQMILNWWSQFEQESLRQAIKYSLLTMTDIADFYPSIYTHSIPWALHGREEAKKHKHAKDLLGNKIDFTIQSWQYGQTNGIPQGSVLTDFLSEIILGYADIELDKRIKGAGIDDCHVLRFRDDYRIFTKSSSDSIIILQELSKVLEVLNLKLNRAKTFTNHDIISSAIKEEKRWVLSNMRQPQDPVKRALLIHELSQRFPQSGALIKELSLFSRLLRKSKISGRTEKVMTIIAIVVGILINNPRSVPQCILLFSILLRELDDDQRNSIIKDIYERLSENPNTSMLEIWFQRLNVSLGGEIPFTSKEQLCGTVDQAIQESAGQISLSDIWASDWLPEKHREKFNKLSIINKEQLNKVMGKKIKKKEIFLFTDYP